METLLLDLRNVTKTFKVGGGLAKRNFIKAVDNVSFSMNGTKPIVTALVGESGSGKSTIAKIILGILEPTSGKVQYKGKDVGIWLKTDRITYLREVQMIFQDPYSIYNPFHRVDRILDIIIKKFGLASSKTEANNLKNESLREVGLRPEDIFRRYPHQISGGERQRLMLARISLIKPKLVIADEPVSMIDASLRSLFLDNLSLFKEKLGTSYLFITHDLNIANYISDEIMILCRGSIVETGETRSIIREPLHPYTKILVDAMPNPDPKKRWKEKQKNETIDLRIMGVEVGCVFSSRCPDATKRCKRETPTLIEVKPGRKIACFS
jgi:peptide/nickel transport system ATP-binding protein